MNIEKKQIDDLNLEVTFNISKDDYAEAERKKLNDYKRKADIKGFRKGMAPMSLIQRLYGGQVLYDSVNTVLSGAINKFIDDEKLHIVGEPLPNENQPEIEWVSGNDFKFIFDMAVTPEIDFEVGEADKVPYYAINVTKEAKASMKSDMLRQWGSLQEGNEAGLDDFVVADLDNGSHKVEGAYISIRSVAEDARGAFIGAKAGASFQLDVNAAFVNETDRASMLKVKKEELASLDPMFTFNILNVKTFVPAEENQETYDKMFGEGTVTDAAQFDAKIEERLKEEYRQMADSRLSRDIRDYFLDKASIKLPEDFLRRWLIQANEGKYTAEEVDRDFAAFLADFRWQLVRGRIMKLFDVKVEDSDIREAAEGYAAYQYAMYGMSNVPAERIKDTARYILQDENQVRRLEEQVEDRKAVEAAKAHITLQEKKISLDKFNSMK
jgi:trigger factor